MSDFRLPELPSDEELGITDEDRKALEEDAPADGPELSAQELLALLGDAPSDAKTQKKPGMGWRARRTARGAAAAKEEPKGAGTAGTPPPRRVSEGPRSRWRGPVTLAILIGLAVVASTRTGIPRPVPANAPDTQFSSARAMATLIEIARQPHPTGSPEHARVRELLMDRLRALGMDPEVQVASAMAQTTDSARAVTVRNILARIPGTASTGAVLITAHYDSRELSPGAADDGSGLVTILEAIRALRAGPPLSNDLIVLFSDAEEPCLCGAQAFVDQHPWIDDVSVVLSFEMRGAGGPSIMFETNEQNGWIVRALKEFDTRPFANSMSSEVYRRMPNGTDFTEFREAGKQGLNFAAIDRAHVYHQSTDRPDNLSEATLQHHGLRALAGLRYLGAADLQTVDGPDVVYFTMPGAGLVVYPGSWVVPISGALLALALLALITARVRGARVSGVVTGLGLALLGATGSFGFALWLRTWILGFYPEAGSLSGSILHSEGWWVLTAAAGTLFIVTALHGIARRWLSSAELSLGAVMVPLGLGVWLSLVAPLAAMNLQWPVAAALLAGTLVALLGARASGAVGWLLTVALATPVLALLVPLTELIWLAMTIQLIGPLAVVMALTLHLCLPALDALRHPNSWWAPTAGLVAAAGFFGMAVRSAQPSADRRAPSTLIYAYQHGTGSAFWVTNAGADSVLDAEAIEWAAAGAGSSFSRTRDMSDFGYPAGPMPVTDARVVSAPPPQVTILSDSIEGPVRNVSLSVRSILGAESIRFRLDPPGRTRLLSINGMDIEEPARLEWAEHIGQPDSAGIVLQLRMAATDPIGLYIVEHLLRPRELLGPAPFERPDDLAPDVSAMSDRAVFSYSVAAYVDPRHAFMPGAIASPPAAPAPEPSEPPAASNDSLPPPADSLR
ncbi:MAG: M28 family peptidase [Gemmatimonadota bacterium]|nr:M28 family peptidase [Gemmatimonadota bacterium]